MAESVPRGRGWSVARQLLLLQALLVTVLVVGGAALAYVDSAESARDRAREQVTAVATAAADSPALPASLALPRPSDALQPFAERVRADAGVDFVTIMDPSGVRFSHPNPAMIGKRFLGTIAGAQRGGTVTETYTGTLGPSIRTVVGVRDAGGRVVALVAVGVRVSSVADDLAARLPPLLLVAAAVLAVGVAGSYLVSSRLRRQTRGAAPAELRGMFDYYEAILHSVREGLVLVNSDGTVRLCNDAARDLLALPEPAAGRPVAELGLAPDLAAALVPGEPVTDEIHVTDTRVLVLSSAPVGSAGAEMGTVVTLRDHTELQSLTGELDTLRGFAESLRSQAHESANRLHAVVSLVELGRPEHAVELATAELADAQQLTDQVVGAVAEPVLAALLLGKTADAAERGVQLRLAEGASVPDADTGVDSRDLVTIVGNLIDNAVDSAAAGAAERPARVEVMVLADGGELRARVADSGPGVPEGAAEEIFRRGWSSKGGGGGSGRGLGLALVGQAARKYGGTVEVGADERLGGAALAVRLPLPGEARP